jgi:hypothetical protein
MPTLTAYIEKDPETGLYQFVGIQQVEVSV